MAKAIKTATKTVAASEEKLTREELLATVAGLEFQTCEIVAGRKFPIGEKFDCIKVGVSRWNKPYAVISVNGNDEFCDPANLKPLKAFAPAKIASTTAKLEADKEATLILSGTVKRESENAVLISHHGWFKPRWFPKSLITVIGDHSDGEQNLYEVPMWKIKADHGPVGVADLEALQDGFQKMLAPAKAVTSKKK
jgi:hypothetical protein